MPGCTKIFPSRNPGRGVCMGASAQWCKEASRGYYHFDPHLPHNMTRTKELTAKFVDEIKGGSTVNRLKKLLALAGIPRTTTAFTANSKSTELISYIKKNSGVYLVVAGTHVMGLSSRQGKYYFYDNMNGLYRCHDTEGLEAVIKKLRGPHGEEEWSLSGPDGWRGIKCNA